MIYTIDTEFYEVPHDKSIAGMIDLISIGIVCEDGREFYAENDDFRWDDMAFYVERGGKAADTPAWLIENVRPHLRGGEFEMSRYEMQDALYEFFDGDAKPEFWGWYCDYDWVIFCWLWGRMLDLPEGFPKFCRDLRQAIDATDLHGKDIPQDGNEHDALADARWNMKVYQAIRNQIQI